MMWRARFRRLQRYLPPVPDIDTLLWIPMFLSEIQDLGDVSDYIQEESKTFYRELILLGHPGALTTLCKLVFIDTSRLTKER